MTKKYRLFKACKDFSVIQLSNYRVMIGNDGTSDIAGANKVGMDSLYISTEISPLGEKLEDVDATYIIEDGDFRKISTILLKK